MATLRLKGSASRLGLLLTLLLAWPAALSAAPQALHERIDALIRDRARGALAAPASDAELLRRAYLDLNGIIPTAAEAKAFFADPAADKRQKLVDRLLDGPDYARRMGEAFSFYLLERRDKDDKPNTQFGGPFRSIPTSVPGLHVSELLPLTARQMHRLALVRSCRRTFGSSR